ncbi:MarR family winged helix-turn-helix transcriptional regulator [Chryseolinea soli]|uniref:MarR family transcriptional regulator n=1 Tax=Chryseolinea soli TaxID=2321403 RepID=A0A385SYX6_9BACT|nr:MarR family winged helix-turn-helix transcriptional regulator [Chryseolinea soli]AYB33948.1 MarR family transcriptional regulator [Chryseolinea soli]
MKPLIELVSEWSKFEEHHPNPTLEAFASYLAARTKARDGGKKEKDKPGQLARIIGRLSSAYALYHRAAMADLQLPTPDSFYYLNSLNQLGEVKKMALIQYHFAETTTGMLAINTLIAEGFIKERADPDDGRAKLVKLTEKGTRKLQSCIRKAAKVNDMIFSGLPDDTIDLCCQLLSPQEKKHSQLAVQLKNEPFDAMYTAIMNETNRS